MDINDDGHMDILSGTYSNYDFKSAEGFFQVLYGTNDGKFNPAKRLDGTDEMPLCNRPEFHAEDWEEDVSGDTNEFFTVAGTCPRAADLDGDGELDIVSGNRTGTFYFFEGLGKGKFSPKSTRLMVGKKPLRVSGHSDPTFVDWDGDGDLDMLSGAYDGGVFIAINKGNREQFDFSQFRQLVAPYKNEGDGAMISEAKLTGPVNSTRVATADLNHDGKLDLIVGDMLRLSAPVNGLTEKEARAELLAMNKEAAAARKATEKERNALYDKFDELDSRADKKTGEPGSEADEKAYDKLDEQLDVLNAPENAIRSRRGEIVSEKVTGFVWVYYQK